MEEALHFSRMGGEPGDEASWYYGVLLQVLQVFCMPAALATLRWIAITVKSRNGSIYINMLIVHVIM